MQERILVVNPNSTEAVTRGMDEACERLRMSGGPAIECVTLAETKDHLNWELLALVAEKVKGPESKVIQEA